MTGRCAMPTDSGTSTATRHYLLTFECGTQRQVEMAVQTDPLAASIRHDCRKIYNGYCRVHSAVTTHA